VWPQEQYYDNVRQYRFFRRLSQAFVRVGLISQTSTATAYVPGQHLDIKPEVRGRGGEGRGA